MSDSSSREHINAKDGAHRRRSRIFLIAGIVCLLVALAIAVFLLYKYMSAEQKNQSYLESSGMAATDIAAAEQDPNSVAINWDALRQTNSEVVGWLTIPDTRVNYPIVQAADNDYYLDHLFDKTYSTNGALFLDYQNDPKMQGLNNIVYGHNLLDGSMFGGLKDYRNTEFYAAHKSILLFTPEKNHKLEVVAVLICDADDKIRQMGFADDADYQAYAQMLLGYAETSEIDSTNIPENLYLFSTCTSFNNAKRFVILAREVIGE